MDIVKELERLEDLYFGEWEEEKAPLIEALRPVHQELAADEDAFNRFLVQAAERFGGAYIPYLFWEKLAQFMDVPEERTWLQELIRAFANSDFDDEEQMQMKPLLVTYMAKEKDFELDKLRAQVIEKAHPSVREYFLKLITFVKKNTKATGMYCEKFELIRQIPPDFDLLGLPITQLRERLAGV
ncbi:MAG: hypothetical protein D6722_17075 [Bacteroidetes bacterium]|nr:MAG: hypothetical protein D6722_17075 [Bacteroidota bacterium]